jgi:predicted PurR-regulated permease PerM
VSAAGFLFIILAFVFGGRLGGAYDHPHAGRVIAVAAAVIIYRSLRTWIGKEQVKYRKVRVKPPADA